MPTAHVSALFRRHRRCISEQDAKLLIRALHRAIRRVDELEPAPAESAPLAPWITEPCPPWCPYDHKADVEAINRAHMGDVRAVTLTTLDAIRDSSEWVLPEIKACLIQEFREIGPRVWLSHGDMADEEVYLTLAEADQLAANLTTLTATARSAA